MNTCVIEGCGISTRYRELCVKHYQRLRITGTTDDSGWRTNRRPYKSVVGYAGAHVRVYKAKGSARDQACHCGAPAQEWSYDGLDPDERDSAHGPYSCSPAHYVPMCVSCHRTTDEAIENVRNA